MKYEQIAKILSNICYRPKGETDEDFAVQLFVERVVLPFDCEGYSKKEVEQKILNYLYGEVTE